MGGLRFVLWVDCWGDVFVISYLVFAFSLANSLTVAFLIALATLAIGLVKGITSSAQKLDTLSSQLRR